MSDKTIKVGDWVSVRALVLDLDKEDDELEVRLGIWNDIGVETHAFWAPEFCVLGRVESPPKAFQFGDSVLAWNGGSSGTPFRGRYLRTDTNTRRFVRQHYVFVDETGAAEWFDYCCAAGEGNE